MPSRSAYRRLRKLVLMEISINFSRAGSLACVLMERHGEELVDLGLIPSKEGFDREWVYEGHVYGVLRPKVKHQLENLVGEGRLGKVYGEAAHGRRNFKHRIALYYRVMEEEPQGYAECNGTGSVL